MCLSARGTEAFTNVRRFSSSPMPTGTLLMMPSKRNARVEQLGAVNAHVRAKVAHPFRVIKCLIGHLKARHIGLAKNSTQLLVMFAMSNLWMVRKRILRGLQA